MKPGKRIAVLSQLPPPVHGSTVMTELLVEVLSNHYTVGIVERQYSRQVAEVGRFQLRKLAAGLGLFGRTATEVTKRPEVAVVFLTNRGFSFLSDLVCLGILRAGRVPVVSYIHTVGFRSLAGRGPIWARLVRWALRSATATVVLGPSLADDVQWALKEESIYSIPNIPRRRPPNAERARGEVVIFLANLIPEKGADTFIEVAERVGKHLLNVEFRIAGHPADDEHFAWIRRRIGDSSLGDRIRYIGPLDENEKWHFLQESRVLLFPTRYPLEAQPLAIVEALSVGTRVVATDVGGIRDLDSIPGMSIATSDVPALAAAVEAALDSTTAAGTAEPSNWDAMYSGFEKGWLSLIREITAERRAPQQ